ncbi:MAG: glutathione S-transferase N-terminal domain-containing protein [Marinagarivorans sp.]|nr:glutathione S-transferase N-terminal domain-containing protein [Marinagarivorans sp.]
MLVKWVREGLGRVIIFGEWLTRPKAIERDVAGQSRVDEAVKHLSLYQFYACPFCVKVRRQMHVLKLPLTLKSVQKDPAARQALEREGGRIKVPCLRIEEDGKVQWLYESGAIVAYLQQRFGVQ